MKPLDPPTATPRTDAQEIDLSTHTATEGFSPNRRKVDKYVPAKLSRQLETELAAAKAECDLAITRVASILWSGAIDKHTCGDVQQWVTDYTAELARLRAEVERLTKQIKDDNRSYGCELRDPNGTIWEQAAKDYARAERAEADKARLDWLESPAGFDWQWNSAHSVIVRRAAIDAAMKP